MLGMRGPYEETIGCDVELYYTRVMMTHRPLSYIKESEETVHITVRSR